MPNPSTITINNTELSPVLFNDMAVITLAMMDKERLNEISKQTNLIINLRKAN